jgi:hypothetical protein
LASRGRGLVVPVGGGGANAECRLRALGQGAPGGGVGRLAGSGAALPRAGDAPLRPGLLCDKAAVVAPLCRCRGVMASTRDRSTA